MIEATKIPVQQSTPGFRSCPVLRRLRLRNFFPGSGAWEVSTSTGTGTYFFIVNELSKIPNLLHVNEDVWFLFNFFTLEKTSKEVTGMYRKIIQFA